MIVRTGLFFLQWSTINSRRCYSILDGISAPPTIIIALSSFSIWYFLSIYISLQYSVLMVSRTRHKICVMCMCIWVYLSVFVILCLAKCIDQMLIPRPSIIKFNNYHSYWTCGPCGPNGGPGPAPDPDSTSALDCIHQPHSTVINTIIMRIHHIMMNTRLMMKDIEMKIIVILIHYPYHRCHY